MTNQDENLVGDFKIVVAQNEDLPQILMIWERGLKQIYPDIDISENAIEIFKRNFQLRMYPFNFWVAKSTNVLGWCSILLYVFKVKWTFA